MQAALKGIRGQVVGVIDFSFKPNTDDIRESRAVQLIRFLVEHGTHVRAHYLVAIPKARQALSRVEIDFLENSFKMVYGVNTLVLETEWEEYRFLYLR